MLPFFKKKVELKQKTMILKSAQICLFFHFEIHLLIQLCAFIICCSLVVPRPRFRFKCPCLHAAHFFTSDLLMQ